MEIKRIFHFSGGRTSAFMVIKYHKPGDIVLFCDTSKEHEGTYKFIKEFEANEGIPIIKLSYPGGWLELIRKEQMIPNYAKRKCTQQLKIKTARRYLRSLGLFSYEQFVGFRFDEPIRVEKYVTRWNAVKTSFPLYDDKIIKPTIIDFWKTKSYDLEIPEILGNCDLCFLKGVAAAIAIIKAEPWRADRWIQEEESDKNGHTFHKGVSMRQIRDFALSTTDEYDINKIERVYECACTA